MALKPKLSPTTVNASDTLQDLTVVHAINLERLKAHEVDKVLNILDDLGLSVQKALEKVDPSAVGGKYRFKRLTKLKAQIDATVKRHFSKIKATNSEGLSGTALASGKSTQNMINRTLGVNLGAGLPTAANLRSLVSDVMVEGEVVKKYWDGQSVALRDNFMRQMRMGVTGGENLQSLIGRVRGTKANNFTDGIMNASKKKAEALVRSSVAAVNNDAILATYQANEDLFNGYQWLATLDTRTSDICKARSGLTWDKDFQPVGHGISWISPPAHFNCRSTVIGVLKSWSDLADKPLPAPDAGTLKEELEKSLAARGLSSALISKSINKTQQSMDGFVAGDINFEDWLKGKSERFQKQILGEPKWELWKNGKIGFVDLVDQKNNPRSLAELQALVESGRTSPLKANKAARQAAKQQAEAAALAAKAAQKAENAAQSQIDEIISGVGGVNKKKVYDKLKKDGIDGLSATQIMAKVDEGVAQIYLTSNIAKAKKKLKDGKPLSKTEQAAWDTVDADLKTAFVATLEAESAIFKKLDDLFEEVKLDAEYADAFGDTATILLVKKQFANAKMSKNTHLIEELEAVMDDDTLNFLKGLEGFNGLDSVKAAKKLSKEAAEKFVLKYESTMLAAKQVLDKSDEVKKAAVLAGQDFTNQLGVQKGLLMGDPEDFDFVKYGTPKDIEKTYLKAGPLEAKAEADFAIASISHDIKSVNEKIIAAQTKQAEEATEYLEKAAQGGKGFTVAKTAYEKLSKSGGLTGDVVVDAAKVQAKKDELQAAASLAAVKSGIKKKFKAGKKLSPKEQAVFDDLDQVDQELLKDAAVATKSAKEVDALVDAQVTQKVTEKAAQRADEGVLFDDLVQIGDQDGSNVGGLFKSVIDDQEFYVKAPDTELMAKVEVLSSKLYQAAGVKVADVNLMQIKGKIGGRNIDRVGVASRIEKIDDIDTGDMGALSGAKEGFAADAWLANWDVIGNGGPKQLNLKKMADGSSFRIDTGGTLFFRAQGGRKAFSGSDIPELDSLRFNEFNSGKVFGDISEDQIVAGVARIVAISDDDIRRLVSDVMGDDADDLAEVLIGRRDVLQRTYAKQLKKYNKTAKKAPQAPVTKQEAELISESGINGYSMMTDKDEIEDQVVHFYNFTDRKGNMKSGAYFKLRGARAAALQDDISMSTGSAPESVNFAEMDRKILTAIKGISSRNQKGENYLPKDWDRATEAMQEIDVVLGKLDDIASTLDPDELAQVKRYYQAFREDLDYFKYNFGLNQKGSESKHFAFRFSKSIFEPQISPKVIVKKQSNEKVVWLKKDSAQYTRRSFKDGKGQDTSDYFSREIDHFETEIDGVTVRYFGSDTLAAFKNRVEMTVDGGGVVAIEKQLEIMSRLGINTKRATQLDREELYLMKSLYILAAQKGRKGSWLSKIREKAGKFSQEKRIAFLQKQLSKAAEVDDITALSSYNPFGNWQQFGHGRNFTYRPDWHGPEWEDFTENYVLMHELHSGASFETLKNIIEGGGQMAPTMDKLRRGVEVSGMSPIQDMRTGGAQYFFTRIKKKRSDTRYYNSGVYWKSKQAGRTDAISYDSDNYGNTETEDFVLRNRKVTVSDLKDNSTYSGNETIFKDSLSIYDDIEVIKLQSDEDAARLRYYLRQEKKMKKWPDGRELEDVIIS